MKKLTINEKVAKRIKDFRTLKNISQEELAEMSSLHPTLIGKIERAEINSSIATLEKIARAFDIKLSELLAFPDDKDIVNADVVVLNKSIDIIKQILEMAKSYKPPKENTTRNKKSIK